MQTKSNVLVLAALVPAAAVASWGSLPLHFEANRGQAAPDVRFLARGPGFSLRLASGRADFAAGNSVVTMRLIGARSQADATGENLLPGKSNYFTGSDPASWKTAIPLFERVRFDSVYRGIDIVYYGAGGMLEYDFIVQPGADPSSIRIAFDGVDTVRTGPGGDLVLRSAGAEIRQRAPAIYQESAGRRERVRGGYKRFEDGSVGFEIAAYDRSRTLTIDPVIQFATFWGGRLRESATAIALDRAGNVIVVGTSTSDDYPTSGEAVRRRNSGGVDIFVLKLDSRGTQVLFSTLLGGLDDESSPALAVDLSGNVYVSGTTSSTNFPTTSGALKESAPAGDFDGFVTKLSPDGSRLVYSTRLGGRGPETLNAIAIDERGAAYVTGDTRSDNFPVSSDAYRVDRKGPNDAFVSKINPAGSALEYSTLLGGDADTFIVGFETGRAIGVDRAGNAYVAGITTLRDFPVTPNVVNDLHQGLSDIFLTKLAADGKTIVFSTLIGGDGNDNVTALTVDPNFAVYLAGYTDGYRFPTTPGVYQPGTNNDGRTTEAFVMKMNANGQLTFSTMFGGRRDDQINGLTYDAAGNVYAIGTTSSTDLPASFDSFPRGIVNTPESEPYDAFIVTLNPSGNQLLFCTYLGHIRNDLGNAIARDAAGNLFVAGYTQSPQFPVTANALKTVTGFGTSTAFIARIGEERRQEPGRVVVVSGNNQSVEQGATARLPLVAELRDLFNVPISQARLTFTATNGLILSADSGVTDYQGRTQVKVSGGLRVGESIVRVTIGNAVPAEFRITVLRTGPVLPEITRGTVILGGGGRPPVSVLSPGARALLNGRFLAPQGQAAEAGGGNLLDGKLPLSLLNTCVTVGGTAARLFGVNDTQIEFQVPEITPGGTVPVQVITNCGQSGELRSDPELVETAAAAPEWFFWQKTPSGRNPVQAVARATGQGIGPRGMGEVPLVPGSPNLEISVFATGLGDTSPAVGTGIFPSTRARLVNELVLLLDGEEVPAEYISYAGIATVGQPGVYEVDFTIPPDTRNGNLSIGLRSGLYQTPPGAYLQITGGLDLNPKISVSPSRIDLGDVIVGRARDVQFAISNAGSALLELTSFSTGDPALTLVPSFTFSLRPGEARLLTLRYSSNVLGPIAARLSIGSTDPATPLLDLPVTGNVIVEPPAPSPVPTLTSISPNAVDAGTVGFNLIVNGGNFVRSSVVEINGRAVNTFFNHPAQLISFVTAAEIALPGELAITVFTPAPGGGRTAPQNLFIRGQSQVTGATVTINQLDLRFCPNVSSYVSIIDAAGQSVGGFTSAACSEDGILVDCRVLQASRETPLSLTLLYGMNGIPTDEEKVLLKLAVRQMVLSLNDEDRVALIHLDDAREQVAFTTDKNVILNKLDELRPLPDTNYLLDAAWYALQTTVRERGRRQAVLLITGQPNRGGGFLDYTQLIGSVRSGNVPFFTYALGSGGSNINLSSVLRQLASDSGGRYVAETDPRKFADLFRNQGLIFTQQHLVEYRTPHQDAREHTVRFSFSLPGGPITGSRTYTPCLSVGGVGIRPVSPSAR
jgi:uncharacterized protein (TIGR03437 family)